MNSPHTSRPDVPTLASKVAAILHDALRHFQPHVVVRALLRPDALQDSL